MTHDDAVHQVSDELCAATVKFGKFLSPHEGYAIILEELDELKAEVFFRNPQVERMRHEAMQVAAMATRFMMDLT